MIRVKLGFCYTTFRRSLLLGSAVITPSVVQNSNEAVTPKPQEENETGWDRLRTMYSIDEFGSLSKELTAVIQTTFFSGFIGLCYGGFLYSREAYLDFMERNQATKFDNHWDAKKRLQNHVTINFGRGGIKWAWRLAFFCGMYTLLVTTATEYRGYTSIIDYSLAGLLAGAIYQTKIGTRAMIVGATLGGILGLFTGCAAQTLLAVTGSSFREVILWQNQLDSKRTNQMKRAQRARAEELLGDKVQMLEHHEEIHSKDKDDKKI